MIEFTNRNGNQYEPVHNVNDTDLNQLIQVSVIMICWESASADYYE